MAIYKQIYTSFSYTYGNNTLIALHSNKILMDNLIYNALFILPSFYSS